MLFVSLEWDLVINRLRQNLENGAKISAIHKARIPSESEATDRSWERLLIGLAILLYAIVFASLFMIGLRQDTAIMVLMPSWLIVCWYFARKRRLRKLERRTRKIRGFWIPSALSTRSSWETVLQAKSTKAY